MQPSAVPPPSGPGGGRRRAPSNGPALHFYGMLPHPTPMLVGNPGLHFQTLEKDTSVTAFTHFSCRDIHTAALPFSKITTSSRHVLVLFITLASGAVV